MYREKSESNDKQRNDDSNQNEWTGYSEYLKSAFMPKDIAALKEWRES